MPKKNTDERMRARAMKTPKLTLPRRGSAKKSAEEVAKRKPQILKETLTPRAKKGQFVKGVPKPPTAGRAKGTRNKTTIMLKEAILTAAGLVGSDGRGKNGLVGYLEDLARKHKPLYSRLLEKVLPMQIAVKETGRELLTPDEAIEKLKERGLPVPESLKGLSVNVKATMIAHALNDSREDGESDDLDNRRGAGSSVVTFEKDGLDDLDEEDDAKDDH